MLIFLQINFLVPGILGAVTLYVLNRKFYFWLVFEKKWPRFLTTVLVLVINAILLLIPFGILITALAPKINDLFSNTGEFYLGIREIIKEISTRTSIDLSSNEYLQNIPGLISKSLPQVIGTASSLVINSLIVFFLLFFMLYNAEKMEKTLVGYIPLHKENVHRITAETKSIVTSYAVGIPVLAISQGIAAYIGYSIFGIHDKLLWAFATCVCSIIPFVGSAIIIIPLVVYLFASHQTGDAIGLTFYSAIVVMNIDNVLRLFLLKIFADIHPLITLIGVITGLKLFGFIGLIFGPLLVSYFLLLIKIYSAEFTRDEIPD